MEKLSKILTEDLFLNAYEICQNYCKNDSIRDVNFRLISKQMLLLTPANVKNFYRKYIETDIIFAVPELFSCDVVFIPKNLSGVREYRYFSCFSMILYNAVGLIFIECCDQFLASLNFKKNNIYSYRPTRFVKEGKSWVAKNEYQKEYKSFSEKCKTEITTDSVVLKFDIGSYFESIQHNNLIGLLKYFSPKSTLKRFSITSASEFSLKFYFESLMGKIQGIPQGRKNFVSDYFGYLYLLQFDMRISDLASSRDLKLCSSVRYVDDVFLVFSNELDLPPAKVYQELLKIEQKISGWLHSNLSLSLQPHKTERYIIQNQTELDTFWKIHIKAVSSTPVQAKASKIDEDDIEITLTKFLDSLEKFCFTSEHNFKFDLSSSDREILKKVFESKFRSYLLKPSSQKKLINTIQKIDFDLTANSISILATLWFLTSKKKKQPYEKFLNPFLSDQINLSDKRHIHIILELLAVGLAKKRIRKIISKYSSELLLDNYGKYLAVLFDHFDKNQKSSVYRRIYEEYSSNTRVSSWTFLFKQDDLYLSMVVKLVRDKKLSQKHSLVQPLKLFVFEYKNERWDTAFNYFNNFFHELCKVVFELEDRDTVVNVVSKIKDLSLSDELIVLQFYDRRNFNAISHPSKDGQSAIKVSEQDINYFMETILLIIHRYLLK